MRLNVTNPVNKKYSLNRGRISWWLNLPNRKNGGGLVFRDLMGRNHGTLTNGPTWRSATGRPGGFGALSFDGTDDYLTAGIPPTTMNTVAFWYFVPASFSGLPTPLVQGDDAFNDVVWDWGCYHDGANLTFHFQGTAPGGVFSIPLTGLGGTWAHICVVRKGDDTFARGYLNGSLSNSDGLGTHTLTNAKAMRTLTVATTYAVSKIDDIAGWNRPFSAAEVLALYNESRLGYPRTLNWIRTKKYFFMSQTISIVKYPVFKSFIKSC
jgi:hypothetical protein